MRYNWSLIKNTQNLDFPETFVLKASRGHQYKIEVNRLRGMVRLLVEERSGNKYQSVISNGVVIRELDALTGRSFDLDSVLTRHSIDLSSLPDNQVLQLIGGNYGVMTEFLGKAKRIYEVTPNPSKFNLHSWFMGHLKRLKQLPLQWFAALISIIKRPPKLTDIIDTSVIASFSFYIYLLNFSFLQAGALACAGGLSSGFVDFFIRKRAPYLIKVFFLFIPGVAAIWLGYHYQ